MNMTASNNSPLREAPKSPTQSLWQALLINIIPLVGVLGFRWDATLLLLTYWLENIVIGFFNILRMATARSKIYKKFFIIPFFTLHYGAFCAGHVIFILTLCGKDEAVIHQLFESKWAELNLNLFNNSLPFILGAYILIYAWDFIFYLWKYYTLPPSQKLGNEIEIGTLMFRPYIRIITLHIAIVLGGGVAMALNSPLWILVVLALTKSAYDFVVIKKIK
jgi:hypothetical protein